MIIFFCVMSLVLSSHSTITNNIFMPVCPESFCDAGVGPFKYPFYSVTDTGCGLIKVTCTSNGGEIKFGGSSYEIVGKYESDYINSDRFYNIVVRNDTFHQLVKSNSCEALMNNFTFPSPSPQLYLISIFPLITLFKCKNNSTFGHHTDAYFSQHDYDSHRCKDHNFYYKQSIKNVPSDLPPTCQVVQLPLNWSAGPGHDETNIFSLLSSHTSVLFNLSPFCKECLEKGQHCDYENGHPKCIDVTIVSAEEPSRGQPDPRRKLPHMILVLVAVLGVGSVAILVVIILYLKREPKWRKMSKCNAKVEMFLKTHDFLAPKRYSYSQVKKMTDSFKVKLGQGGFGTVYKGMLKNQNLVAVKLLSEVKGDGEDFINEVASVSMTSHVNIVSLMGFCLEGRRRALIYEFMPNGSLEKFIYSQGSSSSTQLEWEKLYQIAIGIARGLEYLYRGCSTRILHFDIKPHNILLDNDFCPKISDFGMAKLVREKESRISMSHMRGTPGYIAPELFSRNFGEVSHKSDVYSYGMMILEMVGGRKNIEVGVDHTSEIYFPHWIYKKVELHEQQLGLHGIVNNEEHMIARKMIIVGLWCIQTNPLNRPTISKVLEMLEGDFASLEVPPKPYLSSPTRCDGSPSIDSLHPYCSCN